eukprot:12472439-Alexandrium_andersonii.AAC.1
MALSAAWHLQASEPPGMQIRAPEAPREAQRLQRPPLKSGAQMLADSEPRRGPFGSFGAMGRWPPSEGLEQNI